jgi:peptide/nickel transport system permease protein
VSAAPALRPSPPRPSPLRRILRDGLRPWRARLGLALVVFVTQIAVLGPRVAPHSPTEFVADPYDDPSSAAWFGADSLGRDVLSRFLFGGLPVFMVALPATMLGVGLGAALGLLAAALRGPAGEFIMRVLDVLLAFPQIVLALLFLTILGPEPWLLVFVVAAAHMPQTARVIRGTAAEIVERDFVRAAETIGAPWRMIVLRDLLPNVSGQLLVEAGLRFTYSIGIVAALGFLGFGRPPPQPDWGLMISENKLGLTIAPWGALLPVIAIALLTVGANLAIDALGRAVARVSEARP